MKTTFCLMTVAGFLLAGCGGQSDSASGTNAASGGNPLTAPVDYLDAAAKGHQSAVKTVDVASLNQAIQMFNLDKGRNPKDLNELVAEKYLPKIPAPPYGMKFDYNPTTGKVKAVKQ